MVQLFLLCAWSVFVGIWKPEIQTSIYWLISIVLLTFVPQLRACAVCMTLRSKDKSRHRSKKGKSCMPEVTILNPKSFLGFQVYEVRTVQRDC